ncbi:MAG: HAD-IIIA family hydrolase [Lachnospiraceae bacterium]|nr:HAD-IIIA family hydrolase [Lachnospiraceae bacterium]
MRIRYFIMDVDGTLTDGKIYVGQNGEMFKAFYVRDGYAVNTMLRAAGIKASIITGRKSEIVERRSEELHIPLVFQGVADKCQTLMEMLRSESEKDGVEHDLSECAYIGDDLPDLDCMKMIREGGGFVACPHDAIREIKEISQFVSSKDGGNGAVRETVEYILKENQS